MKRPVFASALLVLFLTLAVPLALADSFGPPADHTLLSYDHQYVLVSLVTEEQRARFPDAEIDLQLRKKYPISGLYTMDEIPRLLWPFDRYIRSEFVSSDGIYMFGYNGFPYSVDDIAVTLYKEGKEIRSYRLADLIQDSDSVPRTSGLGAYMWLGEKSFDIEHNRVTIITSEQRRYTFDLFTGLIIEIPPWYARPGVMIPALVLLCFGAAWLLAKRFLVRHRH